MDSRLEMEQWGGEGLPIVTVKEHRGKTLPPVWGSPQLQVERSVSTGRHLD